MSRQIYSARLGEVTAATVGTAYPVVTVPAGYVAVIKCTTAWCYTGAGNVDWLRVSGSFWMNDAVAAIGGQMRSQLHLVLTAGEILDVIPRAGSWQVSAHGFLLAA